MITQARKLAKAQASNSDHTSRARKTIYFGSGDRKIWALTFDGMTKWQHLTEKPIMATPLALPEMRLADGSLSSSGIVIGGLDGTVYKLLTDGSLAWTFETGGQIRGGAAVTRDGQVVVGATDHYLYALNARSGALEWSYHAAQEITSTPVVQDVSITFGTRQDSARPGRIIALSKTGSFRWEINVTTSVKGQLIEDPRTASVFAATNDGKIFAVQADGRLLWRYITGGAGGVCGDYSKTAGLSRFVRLCQCAHGCSCFPCMGSHLAVL